MWVWFLVDKTSGSPFKVSSSSVYFVSVFYLFVSLSQFSLSLYCFDLGPGIHPDYGFGIPLWHLRTSDPGLRPLPGFWTFRLAKSLTFLFAVFDSGLPDFLLKHHLNSRLWSALGSVTRYLTIFIMFSGIAVQFPDGAKHLVLKVLNLSSLNKIPRCITGVHAKK